MAKKAKKKRDREPEKQKPKKTGITFGNVEEHLKEPLLLISFLTAVFSIMLTVLGSILPGQEASGAKVLGASLIILLLAAIYAIYRYSQQGRRTGTLAGIPLLVFLTTLFAFWTHNQLSAGRPDLARDLATFGIFFGLFTLFYAMWIHRLWKLGTAGIWAIFFTALLVHMAPASTPSFAPWQGQYISDLDSYFYYRHANTIVETGYVPDRETLAYPKLPPVIDSEGNLDSVTDFYGSSYGSSVFMASVTTMLAPYGFSVHDIAMLYPGVFAAFTILVFYLLLKNLFADMKPYNYVVALLGAFMLTVNYPYASRAVATNCEDDTFGMFLMVSTFLLFVMACRRKSIFISLLAGFSLLLLNMSWGGYSYAVIVLCLFGILYSITGFINKKSAIEHLPYLAITILMSFLQFLILHAREASPEFSIPGIPVSVPLGGALLIGFVLEAARKQLKWGKFGLEGNTFGAKVENTLERYVLPITAVLLLVSAYYLLFVSNPSNVINYVIDLTTRAKQYEIIGMTTAEQKEVCSSLSIECLLLLRESFGWGLVFGAVMIIVLAYLALFKRSLGAVFILTWCVPILYGVVSKYQFQFTASVPAVALGATVGLLVAVNKKDIDEVVRVFPTIALIIFPVFFFLLYNGIFIFGPFGGGGPMGAATPMHLGATGDRIFWEGTLQWLGQQPNDIIVLTWWDYGHWITSVSDRISILDNTKDQRFMVQDIAKFHVVEENETKALEIAEKYGATHVVIDYTMIGKSAAPHFIATSGLGENIPLDRMGAEVECINAVNCGKLIDSDTEGYAAVYTGPERDSSIIIDLTTEYVINRMTMALADLENNGFYRYRIEASPDRENWQTIVDKTSGEYRGMQSDYFPDVKARYVRITGTHASAGNDLLIEGISIYNPRYEGTSEGYVQCSFSPGASILTATPEINSETNEIDMVQKIVFACNNGMGLLFDIRNGQYSPENVYVLVGANQIPWKSFRENYGSSILGIHSYKMVLGNALNYGQANKYADFPTFTTLVYVPGKKETTQERYDLKNVMMTKLYLGGYLEEYQDAGLADPAIEKSKYFTLEEDFVGDKQDDSYWGYVRVYRINYPDEPASTA